MIPDTEPTVFTPAPHSWRMTLAVNVVIVVVGVVFVGFVKKLPWPAALGAIALAVGYSLYLETRPRATLTLEEEHFRLDVGKRTTRLRYDEIHRVYQRCWSRSRPHLRPMQICQREAQPCDETGGRSVRQTLLRVTR